MFRQYRPVHRSPEIFWVPLVEQELLTLPEHLSSSLVFSGVRVTRSLVLCVCFVDRCLSFCPFSFVHCVVCPSIYGFWLLLWYLTDSGYPFGILRILVTPLVSSNSSYSLDYGTISCNYRTMSFQLNYRQCEFYSLGWILSYRKCESSWIG